MLATTRDHNHYYCIKVTFNCILKELDGLCRVCSSLVWLQMTKLRQSFPALHFVLVDGEEVESSELFNWFCFQISRGRLCE